ncbi:MAG: Asp-tRNA(Asn)/Glu-tRNA(Gln) amidotransferase subunit GatB [Patescibacteria group bacterium]
MEYQATIGMEVHAELRTKTKMFCASKNDPDEKHPNINICPVCAGHPGTLPTANEDAIKHVQRVGLALGANVQKFSRFDRKNYFYPDLPKGYQISQYQHPLVFGGELNGIHITRVHLEEDTARLIHNDKNDTLVDFNRAGVPLMELVTEPDLHDAVSARKFCEELQLVLRYLGASDADMEKGQMRCEANISISLLSNPVAKLGTKVEVKNLNSFRAVEEAIEYETERQKKVLEKGEEVMQETRGWDENKKHTFSQRKKESAHDYRYFPEPDLPPMEFSDEYIEVLKATIPELPAQKRARFRGEYGISEQLVETLVRGKNLASFWEKMVSELRGWISEKGVTHPPNPPSLNLREGGEIETKSLFGGRVIEAMKIAANYFTSDLLGLIKEKEILISEILIKPEEFAELIKMIVQGEISSRAAKDVLRHMVEKGGDPSTIVQDKGLGQLSDEKSLEESARKIISQNPNAISDYKKGKTNALQFLVGQVMKETKGAGNPEVIKTLLTRLIGGV